MHHEVQERTLLNARRLGIRVLHNVVQGDVLDIHTRHFAIPHELFLVHEVHASGKAIAFVVGLGFRFRV
jgi:hypothetical protein